MCGEMRKFWVEFLAELFYEFPNLVLNVSHQGVTLLRPHDQSSIINTAVVRCIRLADFRAIQRKFLNITMSESKILARVMAICFPSGEKANPGINSGSLVKCVS